MRIFYILISFIFCSCSITEKREDGFFPNSGLDEDAQDRSNTKYNLLDSNDGSQDPNINTTVFKQKF